MPITVRHDAPLPALGGLATAIGQGQAATRSADRDEERARFMLGLREQRNQFDVNTALRLRGQDIEQRQYNTNLAMQDARQQQLLENNALNRQAQLESQAMREEYDVYQQQQAQQFAYQSQAAKTLDEQVFEVEKQAQQLKLNPEGQRILNEKIGGLQKLKEVRASARPDVYANLLGQWLTDYDQSNLSAYEVQEPTAQQKVYDNLVPMQGQQVVPGEPLPPGIYRSLKGTRNGVESWETITIPEPPGATFAEDVQKSYAPAPDGGFFMRQPDGKIVHIPPVKPEKSETPKPVDTSKYLKEAASQLRAEHQISQAGSESPTPFKMDLSAAKSRAREIMQAEQELEAELAGASDDDPLIPIFGGSSISGIGTGLAGPVGEILDQAGWDDMMAGNPVEVSSPEEAAKVPVNKTFIFNGKTYRVTGPGEAEPI